MPIFNILKSFNLSPCLIESTSNFNHYDKIIIPGVGAFDNFMEKLKATGLDLAIKRHSKTRKPILGICVGAQVLGESSQEGNLNGLALLPMTVNRFKCQKEYPIPHMGWNTISIQKDHALFQNLSVDHRFYFAHSYHFAPRDPSYILSNTNYPSPFPSIVAKDHIIAVQFHPEKSQSHGLNLLKNFAFNVNT